MKCKNCGHDQDWHLGFDGSEKKNHCRHYECDCKQFEPSPNSLSRSSYKDKEPDDSVTSFAKGSNSDSGSDIPSLSDKWHNAVKYWGGKRYYMESIKRLKEVLVDTWKQWEIDEDVQYDELKKINKIFGDFK